jgi:predicted HTH transcriptional regulator
MEIRDFIQKLRTQVAQGEAGVVLQQLRELLQDSPKLDEVLLQSARHQDIVRQIRLGVIDTDQARLAQNKIHWSLLELLRDIETQMMILEGPHSEYDDFMQDVIKYKYNQNSSSSHPLLGKTTDLLQAKALKNLFSQDRVKNHFSAHHIKRDDDVAHKLRALNLITNGYVLKGTFLCLADAGQIRSVSANAHLSKFFVFRDLTGMKTGVAEFVSGNLVQQYEQMVQHIKNNLYLLRDIDTRKEDYEIPEVAFTELVANAFIHRSYENEIITDVKVELYHDRLEITNPGQFPEELNLEFINSNNKSFIFNPEIAQIFYLHRFAETAAKGINRSQKALAAAGLRPAIFEQRNGYVRVVVYKKSRSINGDAEVMTHLFNEQDEEKRAQADRLTRLRDEAAWEAAVELDTIEAYEVYLEEGFTLRQQAAETRIVELQAVEMKRKAEERANRKRDI